MNKKTLVVAGVVCLAVIAVGAIIYFTNQTPKQDDLAAIVNGVPITMDEFDRQFADMEASSEQYSADEKEERLRELKQLTIDQMIDSELSRQLAVENGITVSDEQVQEQYELVVETVGGEKALGDMLSNQNMTNEEFRKQIYDQMLIEAYIERVIGEPEVTDAEVQEDYNANQASYTGEDGAVLPFDEVKDQIHDMLMADKQAEKLNALVDEFREKSTIAIFVVDEGTNEGPSDE